MSEERYMTEHRYSRGKIIIDHNKGKEAYEMRATGYAWRVIREQCGKHALNLAKGYAKSFGKEWPVRKGVL